MIRTKGEAGTGNIVEAVRHMRKVQGEIKRLTMLGEEELMAAAKEIGAPFEIVKQVAKIGRLPVPNFAAGGIANPADASLMMQLGAESCFVGSGIFKSGDPKSRAEAIVRAVTHYDDPDELARISEGLGDAMVGINIDELTEEQKLAGRGW
jgi:pyridoxal 5'-phosphate synthase pdxS subunit